MDISKLKLPECTLEELDALEKAISDAREEIKARNINEARVAAAEIAKKYGMTVEELLQSTTQVKGKTVKGTPKYENPADPKQVWTGRGRKPGWVAEHLDAGGKLEDLAIQAA